jgi:hypothetical protein
MKTKPIFIVALLSLLISCRKKFNEILVEGKVRNALTKEIVTNQKIYLVKLKNYQEEILVDSTITDASGNYQFIYKSNRGAHHVRGPKDDSSDPRFFRNERQDALEDSKITKVDIDLIPKAYLLFDFKSINSNTEANHIYFYFETKGTYYYPELTYSFGAMELTSNTLDNMNRIDLYAEKVNKLYYTIHIDDTSSISDVIELNPKSFETKNITINY